MHRSGLILLCLAAVAFWGAAPVLAGVAGSDYTAQGLCGPYPRAAVRTAPGLCMGIVAAKAQGLVMPRAIVEAAPARFIVTDMHGWGTKKGRVLSLSVDGQGGVAVQTLFSGLRLPHGVAKGPDGRIYVGEAHRIFRFDPNAALLKAETVIDALPVDGNHPLKQFVFDGQGHIILNIGAPNDRCEAAGAAQPPLPCPMTQGARPRAALWRIRFDKPGGTVTGIEALARGLRNSMALAVHPKSGMIVQGENSIDLEGEEEPAEELNIITPGGHYGWPHCVEMNRPLFGAAPSDCASMTKPAVLMPGHSAPLGMLFYQGALFPALKGKLIVGLHGYRAHGHRIVAYDTQSDGTPMAPKARSAGPGFPLELVTDWDRVKGSRPRGAPVGIAEAHDGALWFVEDKNKSVMVLIAETGSAAAPVAPSGQSAVPPAPNGWAAFQTGTLAAHCGTCHSDLKLKDPAKAWAMAYQEGWVDGGAPAEWLLIRAIRRAPGVKPMPPSKNLMNDAASRKAIEAFIAGAKP